MGIKSCINCLSDSLSIWEDKWFQPNGTLFSDVPHMVTFLMGCVHRYFATFQTTKVGDIWLMKNDGNWSRSRQHHSDGFASVRVLICQIQGLYRWKHFREKKSDFSFQTLNDLGSFLIDTWRRTVSTIVRHK